MLVLLVMSVFFVVVVLTREHFLSFVESSVAVMVISVCSLQVCIAGLLQGLLLFGRGTLDQLIVCRKSNEDDKVFV